tara:strand:+ start:211 stop:612 length:402 start_codon:yes stop_codon:yes gene_type:complete
MKKFKDYLFLITSCISFSVIAEVAFDKNNPEHKLDNYCVVVASFARDLLFNDVQVVEGKVWMYTVEPTADIQKARSVLADLSNTLILRYEYSREFNNQYNLHAKNVKLKAIKKGATKGAEFLKKELEICTKRG